MTLERHMLTFDVGTRRFNYRVAGIALRQGHVLVCREDDDDYVMLPGGRVEMGEASALALMREVDEELRCTAVIGRPVFLVENFFAHKALRVDVHEIGVYYLIDLPDAFPFRTDGLARETEDEGHILRFSWVPAEPEALQAINLRPNWLTERLGALPAATEHLIVDEPPR